MNAGIFYNSNYIMSNRTYLDEIETRLRSVSWGCKIVGGRDDLNGVDVLIVLGGDGTILTIATDCALRGIPIMGINYGKVGFLAEYERENLSTAMDILLSGDYTTDERSILKAEYGGKTLYALNDIVLQRSTGGNAYCNTINITAEIDGSVVDNFRADGIIVSTPTGSTAYALSAGGSVLTPDLEAFSLTPICAHSLHSRPIVYSDRSSLILKTEDTHTAVNVVKDGTVTENTCEALTVRVTKADFCVKFITSAGTNFFNNLLFKLNKWSK